MAHACEPRSAASSDVYAKGANYFSKCHSPRKPHPPCSTFSPLLSVLIPPNPIPFVFADSNRAGDRINCVPAFWERVYFLADSLIQDYEGRAIEFSG